MIKTFKKAIAIMLTLVFVLSIVPVSGLASTEEDSNSITKKIAFTNYAYSRSSASTGDPKNTEYKYGDKTTYHQIIFGGSYKGYAQLDFSGYEEILGNSNTKVIYKMITGGSSSSHKCGDFQVFLMPDTTDHYNWETITYNIADNMGLHETGGRPVLYSKSGTTASRGSEISGEVNSAAVIADIGENYDNSVTTLSFTASTNSYLRLWTDSGIPGIYITYIPNEINNQEYVNSAAEKLTWDILSDDEIDSAANDLNLPSKFYGANVTWKSSNPDVITDDGKVIGGKGTVETVTLTASLSYQGIEETAELGTATKDFVITCRPEEMVTVYVPFSNYRYTRDNGASLKYEEYGYRENTERGVIYITANSTQWRGYMQLDLSSYEEILRSPHATVDLSIVAGSGNSSSCAYDFYISLAPDSADNYFVENEKLSFVKAVELGIHDDYGKPADTRPVLFERTDSTPIKNNDLVQGEGNIQGLVSTLSESATNGLVTLYVHTNNSQSTNLRMNSDKSHLAITYYESEIDNEDYFKNIKSSFKWENITSDAADLVVNDLPTYFKGAKVVWSSGEEVITSSGELTPVAGQIIDATLKATVTYGDYSFEKSFDVKVSDNGITLSEPVLTSENGVATASFSVSNRTAEDVTYKLYLATYKDNELMEVKPFEFTINKGTDAAKNDLAANLGDGYTAKFFVWDADGITPVVKNK